LLTEIPLGLLQGYALTGGTTSYEAFLGIVQTMMVQYSKFNKMAHETSWCGDVASINYIETSTWTRQEHNGFSHQNLSFIGAVLNLKPIAARVYLPPDTITFCPPLCTASSPKITSTSWSAQSNPLPSFSGPTKPRATTTPTAQSRSSPPQITASTLTS
jgi:xylulose-5-phosphate/fructose-6-phosphate phosphoketolase